MVLLYQSIKCYSDAELNVYDIDTEPRRKIASIAIKRRDDPSYKNVFWSRNVIVFIAPKLPKYLISSDNKVLVKMELYIPETKERSNSIFFVLHDHRNKEPTNSQTISMKTKTLEAKGRK